MRSGDVSSSAEVQPFLHRPPRLVGNSRPVTVTTAVACETDAAASVSTGVSTGVSVIAHCRAQYGQWVRATGMGS